MPREMKSLAVLARKGGTGKTTTAVNLAMAAHLRGQRALLADVDPQYSAYHALSARHEPGPGVLTTIGGKLWTAKAAARDSVDLFVIDTPAGADANVLHAVHVADLCLLVTRPNFLDLAAATMSASSLRHLSKPCLIVLSQCPPKRGAHEAPATRKAREALRFTNYPIAATAISTRTVYNAAIGQGVSPEELDPLGPAAAELAALWTEVEAMLSSEQPALKTGRAG
jgi:chromosome partitioning protein